MSDIVFVIGHKSPDTDSTVSAVVAADFLNQRDQTDIYRAVVTGRLNTETEYVFDYFDVVPPPEYLPEDSDLLFLVDHNEVEQRANAVAKVVGVIDHHKFSYSGSEPIEITCRSWGSTSTVLYDLYQKHGLTIPTEYKGLLLSALLSDTVILRSPTTTDMDRAVALELATSLQADLHALGMSQFKAKAQIASKTAAEIIHNDFKDFAIKNAKFGIGQIELVDLLEVEAKIPEIIAELTTMHAGYHTLILAITDILAEGSKLIVVSEDMPFIERIFKTTVTNNVSLFIPGMMSRKKQIVPVITDAL